MEKKNKSGITLSVKEKSSKSMEKAVLAICAAVLFCLVAASLVNYEGFINGAKVTLNGLFALSEARQNYIYRHYDASGSNSFFLSVAVIGVACVLTMGAVKKNRYVPAALLGVLCLGELYFGVMPPWYINLPLVGLLVFLMLGRASLSGIAMLTAAAVAVGGAALALTPSEMPRVDSANESIRDLFDEGEQMLSAGFAADMQTAQENKYKNTQTDKSKEPVTSSGKDNGRGGSKKHASNILTISVSFVKILVLALLASALAVWCLIALAACLLRSRALKKKSGRELVEYCFRRSLLLLETAGLGLSRSSTASDYNDEIGRLISEDYKREYIEATEIRQIALYSKEKITPSQEEKIRSFYRQTRSLALKKQGVFCKMKTVLVKLY